MQSVIIYITPGFENVDATAPLKELLGEIAQAGGTAAQLILSGETIDLLAEPGPELLRQYALLHTSGKLRPASTFAYDPAPGEFSAERLIRSAELRLAWLQKNGIAKPNVFFSPAPLSIAVISGLAKLGFQTIIVRDRSNRSVTPVIVSSVGVISVLEDGLDPPIRVTVIDRPYLRTLTFPSLTELVHGTKDLKPVDEALKDATKLPLERAEIEHGFAANDKIQPPAPASPIVNRFRARRALLEREFEPVPILVKNSAHFAANSEHQRLAELYLLRLRTPESQNEKLFGDPIFRHYLYRSMLLAQVEIDAVSHPDIDPTAGWVDLAVADFDQDGIQEIQFDSQLQRLFLRGTSLIGWEYKPRKADFLNLSLHSGLNVPAGPAESSLLWFCRSFEPGVYEPVEVLEQAVEKPKLIRQAPDLITVRFKQRVKLREKDGSIFSTAIVKDLSMRAGVGAHLNNATTGFQIEYWLETGDKIDDSLLLCDEWNVALPSPDADGWIGRLLHGGGGTSEHPFQLAEQKVADGYKTPGGLHGFRLIDGLGPLVIDLRSSKPLTSASVKPIATEENFEPAAVRQIIQGLNVRLAISAKRIADDYHTNNLFVSIL